MRIASNKAQLPATCPRCGRESTEYGCRSVPLGWWCLSAGLAQDPATFLHPSVAADPAATDPAVKRAREEEATARADFERADARWVDCVAEHRAAELKTRTGPLYFTADLTPLTPDRNTGEERELRDREADAREHRDSCARQVVNARQAAWAAEAAARRRGERT
jgi:hypothetical protein